MLSMAMYTFSSDVLKSLNDDQELRSRISTTKHQQCFVAAGDGCCGDGLAGDISTRTDDNIVAAVD